MGVGGPWVWVVRGWSVGVGAGRGWSVGVGGQADPMTRKVGKLYRAIDSKTYFVFFESGSWVWVWVDWTSVSREGGACV